MKGIWDGVHFLQLQRYFHVDDLPIHDHAKHAFAQIVYDTIHKQVAFCLCAQIIVAIITFRMWMLFRNFHRNMFLHFELYNLERPWIPQKIVVLELFGANCRHFYCTPVYPVLKRKNLETFIKQKSLVI